MITVTPTSFPAAVRYVKSLTGASEEDAEKVVHAVAAFAVAQYMADQANKLPAAPEPHGVTMDQVKAYVDGRLEGRQGMPNTPLGWALDTLMLEYEDGGTFEHLSADIRRILREVRT